MYDCSQDIQEEHLSTVNSRLYRKKLRFPKEKYFRRRNPKSRRDATRLISHKTCKDPRRPRINATPKKGSTGTKEPIDNARTSFSPSVLLLPLSLRLSLPSAENYEGPARSGCVNDQSWPARALGLDAIRAARAGGCHVRIYISDFLFMQLFVRES